MNYCQIREADPFSGSLAWKDFFRVNHTIIVILAVAVIVIVINDIYMKEHICYEIAPLFYGLNQLQWKWYTEAASWGHLTEKNP